MPGQIFTCEATPATARFVSRKTCVKYNRISVVLVNAVREQQDQIEKQQQQITRQQAKLEQQRLQIENLKKLICLEHTDTDVCREK
jgi:type III secretory pathway lipoprotein EscJ